MITIQGCPIINSIHLAVSTLDIICILPPFLIFLLSHDHVLFFTIAVWGRYTTEQSGTQLCSCSSNPVTSGRAGKIYSTLDLPVSSLVISPVKPPKRLTEGGPGQSVWWVRVEEDKLSPGLQRPTKRVERGYMNVFILKLIWRHLCLISDVPTMLNVALAL